MTYSKEPCTFQSWASWTISIWVTITYNRRLHCCIYIYLYIYIYIVVPEERINFLFNLFFSVQEVHYEKISPQFDAASLNECTEMKFTVHPNTDYFTRWKKSSFFYSTMVLTLIFFWERARGAVSLRNFNSCSMPPCCWRSNKSRRGQRRRR